MILFIIGNNLFFHETKINFHELFESFEYFTKHFLQELFIKRRFHELGMRNKLFQTTSNSQLITMLIIINYTYTETKQYNKNRPSNY